MQMQKIVPCLWYEEKAEEAVDFYVAIFSGSKRGAHMLYGEESAKVSGMPEGSLLTVDFEIAGQKFMAMNGGAHYKFSPAISFMIGCETEEEIDYLYNKLSEGGKVLMEFGKYPFAEKYAWINDKYGVSWQLILAKKSQKITPVLMFTGEMYGRAKEAMDFYVDMFKELGEESEIKDVTEGLFTLSKEEFVARDSGDSHNFSLNSAVSFIINCYNQEEITYFWDKIGISGKPSQCGWVEDKFGVNWQVTPIVLNELLLDPDPAKTERVMKAMLKMTKLNIEELKKAYANTI